MMKIMLLNLLSTIIIHPVPIWIYRYLIRKKPINPKKAKRIVIIDAVCVIFIFLGVASLIGQVENPISFAAIFFWSGICYISLTKGYTEETSDISMKIIPSEQPVKKKHNPNMSVCDESYGFESSTIQHVDDIEQTESLEADICVEQSGLIQEQIICPPIRFCHKCGFELVPGSLFCSKCGSKIQ